MEEYNNLDGRHFQELSSFNEHIDNIDWLNKTAPTRASDRGREHINQREPMCYGFGLEVGITNKTPNLNKLCNKHLLITKNQ